MDDILEAVGYGKPCTAEQTRKEQKNLECFWCKGPDYKSECYEWLQHKHVQEMEKLEAERKQEFQRQQRQKATREPKINFVCLTSAMAL